MTIVLSCTLLPVQCLSVLVSVLSVLPAHTMLPDYRDTLHCLVEWLVVSVRQGMMMDHRHLLTLLLSCTPTQADSGRRGEGGEMERDGGGGHRERVRHREGEPETEHKCLHLPCPALPCLPCIVNPSKQQPIRLPGSHVKQCGGAN